MRPECDFGPSSHPRSDDRRGVIADSVVGFLQQRPPRASHRGTTNAPLTALRRDGSLRPRRRSVSFVDLSGQDADVRRLRHGFSFTASDQQFYADRQFSEPRRCPACRAAKKAARGESTGSYSSGGGYGGGVVAIAIALARCSAPRATAVARKLASRSARPARSPSTAATASAARRQRSTQQEARWGNPPGFFDSAEVRRSLDRPPGLCPRIASARDVECLEHLASRCRQRLRHALASDGSVSSRCSPPEVPPSHVDTPGSHHSRPA